MTIPHKPRRVPAVVRSGELYSLQELRSRLQWQEHACRQARILGLRTILFGSKKYVLGEDVLSFFRKLGEKQGGTE